MSRFVQTKPSALADGVVTFLSTFILMTQNRMTAQAEKRADLDLQISLLAEHEITRLITLTTAIAARLGIDASHDPELAELAKDVAPEQVLDTMEAMQERAADATLPEKR